MGAIKEKTPHASIAKQSKIPLKYPRPWTFHEERNTDYKKRPKGLFYNQYFSYPMRTGLPAHIDS